MKAWEIVGYDHDGARYCLDCAKQAGLDLERGSPVFVSDLDGMDDERCGNCNELLID
jgi:hypothetical protein